jgi:LysR family cys regulon transcriptional activator
VNFQQLRIIREAVRRNFNLTEVASALNTSQSGVSKHIKDLEDELRVELFVRRGKRLLGLTEPGKELAQIVERMLLDQANIRRLADQYAETDRGELVIATTHTQARYALPQAVAAFRKAYPDVHLVLHQASPKEIMQMLVDGDADVGIATEAVGHAPELAAFPYYTWNHAVIVPKGHDLGRGQKLTLETLGLWPIITYDAGFTGRPTIDAAFAKGGIAPDIVMAARDADVIKTYVELGLGVGIVASMAFQPERDAGLVMLDAALLFGDTTSHIAVRRGRLLRGFAYRFIELCQPKLTEVIVKSSQADSPAADGD